MKNQGGKRGCRLMLLPLAAYVLVACAAEPRVHHSGLGDDHFDAFLQYRGLPGDGGPNGSVPTSGGEDPQPLPHCTAATFI